jgi:hypothetical protein
MKANPPAKKIVFFGGVKTHPLSRALLERRVLSVLREPVHRVDQQRSLLRPDLFEVPVLPLRLCLL